MYSGVNMLGMALSLACVIIIFRYVYGEFTVDRFNKNLDRVYVTMRERSTNIGEGVFAGTFRMNVETVFDLTKHPGVESYSDFYILNNEEIDLDNQKYNATVLVADSNFVKITDYPVVSGIANLSDPNSALITQSFARKLFGNQDPLGQTFRHSNGNILSITGVIGQIPTKTTLSFDIIVPYYVLLQVPSPQTFVLLYPGVDYRTVNQQYEAFFEMPLWQSEIRYQLFPMSDVYFAKNVSSSVFRQGNYNHVTIITAVGILILLAGIINYINMYTVVILRRGRELGIKKVFGAKGHNIFMQLVFENLLMTGFALISAFIIVWIANPLIKNVLQLYQVPNIRFDLFLTFAILLCLPLITTLFPFFRYHYSRVVNTMQAFDKIRNTGNMRRIFLSFQYVITIVMIIVSLFFVKQFQFMLNTEPGYRTKDIIKAKFIKLPSRGSETIQEWITMVNNQEKMADEIVQKMNACPLFTDWTYGVSPNEFGSGAGTPFKMPGEKYKNILLTGVNESWLRLLDIKLKEGRLWDDETDNTYNYYLIVSESVLKLYGITDFNRALLQPENRLWMSADRPPEEMQTNPPYQIVGVVEDFDYLHLSQKSEPIAFYYFSGGFRGSTLMASIVPGRTQDAIEFLRNLHDETVGGEFIYSFVEDEIREMYNEDKKVATIYTIFTFIAIFISALGLFSMSLFEIQQRRKEIAIRKVLGASVVSIVKILSKEYLILVGVAMLVAFPLAYYWLYRVLQNYAHHINISWLIFALSGLATIVLTLITVGWQAKAAATANPVNAIKSE